MKRHADPLVRDAPVPSWWCALFDAACNPSVFLSEAWLHTWLEVYGAEFQGFWVRWEKDGVVVGGCLLLVRSIRKGMVPFRSLYLNATGEARERTPLAEYNDILYVRGYGEDIAADFSRLVDAMPWDRLVLSGYVEDGLIGRLASGLRAAGVDHEIRPAPYVDLLAIADGSVETTLTANTRSQVRRSRRLYEEHAGRVEIAPASSLQESREYLQGLAQLHNSRWQAKGEPGSFASPAVADFHQRLIDRLWQRGEVDLLRVRAGNKTVGYLYNFVQGGKVCFFQSGFAYETNSRFKPGLLTHCLAIDHYWRRGCREYDFLAGDAQYKRSLAKFHRNLCWAVLYRDRAWMRLALRARDAKARWRRGGLLPESLTGLLRRIALIVAPRAQTADQAGKEG